MPTPTPDAAAAPKGHYLARLLRSIRDHFSKAGAMSADEFGAIRRNARGHAGGKARAERAAAATKAAEGNAPLWVGLMLDADAAAELATAVPGADAAGLHVTLCLSADQLDDVAAARVLVELSNLARQYGPLAGAVGGYGRFLSNGDGPDVFYATPDVPEIEDLQDAIEDCLECCGVGVSGQHGYTPHITLAYPDAGAPNPADALPPVQLRFRALTVSLRGRYTELPLLGDEMGYPSAYTEVADLCATVGDGKDGWRLFNEVRFAEPPDWIPLLPAPGTYAHPVYGDIKITPDRNARFVDGVKRQVYQSKLPVDAEHETKLSGATGWIVDARVNADGSADGRVEWTDRGRALIEADRFKYISPEWYDQWDDPASGTKHRDVLVGAALTTRPFFKDKALRPLVASERGLAVPRRPGADPAGATLDDLPRKTNDAPAADAQPQASKEATAMTDPNAQPVAMSEEMSRRFAEMESQLAAVKTEAAGYKAMAEANAEQAKQAAEAVKSLQVDARRKRFTDVVMGRGEAGNGAAWFGDPAKNVSTLETLADVLGEDSEQFKEYVAQQRALAEQVAQSNLFKEIGTGAPGSANGDNPARKLTEMAEKRAQDRGIPTAEAMAQVAAENPDLYRRYRDATAVKV